MQINQELLQECLDAVSIALSIADRGWLINAGNEDRGKGILLEGIRPDQEKSYRLNWQVFLALLFLKIDRGIDALQAVKLLFPDVPDDPAKVLASIFEITCEDLARLKGEV